MERGKKSEEFAREGAKKEDAKKKDFSRRGAETQRGGMCGRFTLPVARFPLPGEARQEKATEAMI